MKLVSLFFNHIKSIKKKKIQKTTMEFGLISRTTKTLQKYLICFLSKNNKFHNDNGTTNFTFVKMENCNY
jgi:hypothetical protein